MDFEETMDNEELDLSEEVVEEPEEEAEELPTEDVQDEQPEEPKATEPGYVQKRIEKALARERDSMRSQIMAEIEAQYAPIRDRLLEMDAQELVRTRKVADIETARELVALRQGITPNEPAEENSEQDYDPQNDKALLTRINMLKHQAKQILADTGIDVIAEWNNNEDVKQAIMNEEVDFYDVARQMQKRKRPPSPMRSPNGASGTNANAIESMSDAMFDKMEKRIKEGARYTLR